MFCSCSLCGIRINAGSHGFAQKARNEDPATTQVPQKNSRHNEPIKTDFAFVFMVFMIYLIKFKERCILVKFFKVFVGNTTHTKSGEWLFTASLLRMFLQLSLLCVGYADW